MASGHLEFANKIIGKYSRTAENHLASPWLTYRTGEEKEAAENYKAETYKYETYINYRLNFIFETYLSNEIHTVLNQQLMQNVISRAFGTGEAEHRQTAERLTLNGQRLEKQNSNVTGLDRQNLNGSSIDVSNLTGTNFGGQTLTGKYFNGHNFYGRNFGNLNSNMINSSVQNAYMDAERTFRTEGLQKEMTDGQRTESEIIRGFLHKMTETADNPAAKEQFIRLVKESCSLETIQDAETHVFHTGENHIIDENHITEIAETLFRKYPHQMKVLAREAGIAERVLPVKTADRSYVKSSQPMRTESDQNDNIQLAQRTGELSSLVSPPQANPDTWSAAYRNENLSAELQHKMTNSETESVVAKRASEQNPDIASNQYSKTSLQRNDSESKAITRNETTERKQMVDRNQMIERKQFSQTLIPANPAQRMSGPDDTVEMSEITLNHRHQNPETNNEFARNEPAQNRNQQNPERRIPAARAELAFTRNRPYSEQENRTETSAPSMNQAKPFSHQINRQNNEQPDQLESPEITLNRDIRTNQWENNLIGNHFPGKNILRNNRIADHFTQNNNPGDMSISGPSMVTGNVPADMTLTRQLAAPDFGKAEYHGLSGKESASLQYRQSESKDKEDSQVMNEIRSLEKRVTVQETIVSKLNQETSPAEQVIRQRQTVNEVTKQVIQTLEKERRLERMKRGLL